MTKTFQLLASVRYLKKNFDCTINSISNEDDDNKLKKYVKLLRFWLDNFQSDFGTWDRGSDCSHMGRSILEVLLAILLVIFHVSINPTLSAYQSLFIIFAPCRRCCLAATMARRRGGGTLSQQWPC